MNLIAWEWTQENISLVSQVAFSVVCVCVCACVYVCVCMWEEGEGGKKSGLARLRKYVQVAN